MSKTNKSAAFDAAAAAEVTAPTDPFANVPVTRLADDVEFKDFSDVEGNNPFKYAGVHEAARSQRSPMLLNYKHGRAIFVRGTNQKELRPGSVYGDIQAIVNASGRAGIPAVMLVARLRQAQIGNKRSKYCTALPPIGWAEGWINTAVTKSIAGIHATRQAPELTSTAVAEANEVGEDQRKLASNS